MSTQEIHTLSLNTQLERLFSGSWTHDKRNAKLRGVRSVRTSNRPAVADVRHRSHREAYEAGQRCQEGSWDASRSATNLYQSSIKDHRPHVHRLSRGMWERPRLFRRCAESLRDRDHRAEPTRRTVHVESARMAR